MDTSSEGICVAIRMRPMNERELSSGQEKIFNCVAQNNMVTQLKDGQPLEGHSFYYDKVFDVNAVNSDVYSHVAKSIVKGVLRGINGTIFAYGQTSSGKTHTMLGSQNERGILEQAAEDIFTLISDSPERDFLLRVSFVEIYNENIRDLLSDSADSSVAIREDPRKGVYCEASEVIITDFESIIRALKKGISKRAVESTAMNDTSSRSHTIFKLVIESKQNVSAGADFDEAILVASLNLVDLAGSESVKHTGATGQRAKEGGKINQSLLSLSRVIHALSQPGTHVSFRDSKLTRLLQPSLSGNAKMSIVCCITPADRYLEETRSTLQFASRAKLVTTNATVNEVLDDHVKLKRLQKELNLLREKQQFSGVGEEEYARLEKEKGDLLETLNSLQQEKQQQQAQLERLRHLIVSGGGNVEASGQARDSDEGGFGFHFIEGGSHSLLGATNTSVEPGGNQRKNRKKHRDTWCPGLSSSSSARQVDPSVFNGVTLDDANIASLENVDPNQRGRKRTKSSLSSEGGSLQEGEIMQTILAEKTAALMQLESARASQSELQNDFDRLSAENMHLASQLQASQARIEELATELEEANKTVEIERDDCSDDGAENSRLFAELHAANSRIEELESKLDDAKAEVSSTHSELTTQATTFERQRLDLESIVELKEYSILELQQEITLVHKQREKESKLQIELDEARTSKAELMEAVEALTTLNSALSDKVVKVTVDFEAIFAEKNELQSSLSSLSMSNEFSNMALSNALEELENLRDQSDREIERLKAANESLESKLVTSHDELAQANTSQSQFLYISDLKLSESMNTQTELKEKIAVLESQLLERAAADAASLTEVEALQAQNTNQNAKIAALESDIADTRESKDRAFSELSSQLEDISRSLSNERTRAEQLEEELGRALADLSDLRANSHTGDPRLSSSGFEDEYPLAPSASDETGPSSANAISDLASRVDDLQSELANAGERIRVLESDVTQSEELQDELRLQIDSVTSQLADAKAILADTEASKAIVIDQIRNLEAQLECVVSERDGVVIKATAMQMSNSALTLELESTKQQISHLAQLQSLLVEKDSQILALETKRTEMQSSYYTLEKEIMVLQHSNKVALETKKDSGDRTVQQLSADLGTKEAELSRYMSRVADLQTKLDAAEQTIYKSLNHEVSATEDGENSRKRIGQLQTTLDLVKGEKDVLLKKLTDLESSQKSIFNAVVAENESLQAANEQLQGRLDKALKGREDYGRMESAVRALEQKAQELKECKEEAEGAASNAIARVHELEDLSDGLRKELNALQDSDALVRFQREIQMAEEREKTLRDRVAQLSDDSSELSARLKKAKDDNALLISELSMVDPQLKAKDIQLEELAVEKSNLFEALETARQQIQDIQASISSANVSDEATESTARQVESLRAELRDIETLRRAELEKRNAEVDDLNAVIRTHVEEKSQLSEHLQAALQEVQALIEALDEAHSETMELKSGGGDNGNEKLSAELSAEKAELIESLESSLQQVKAVTEALEAAEAELEEAAVSMEAMKEALKASSTRVSDLKAELFQASEAKLTAETAHRLLESTLQLVGEERLALSEQNVSLQQSISELSAELSSAKSNSKSDVGLLEELNALMESKMEFEVRCEALDSELTRLRLQLAEYDKVSADEQEMIMKAAEKEMEALRLKLHQTNETCDQLANDLKEKDDALQRAQSEKSSACIASDASVHKEIETLRHELSVANERIKTADASAEAAEKELASIIEEKEKRIAHLEKHKMTKEHIEMIKRLKEDRKKAQEDNKLLAKQLSDTKKAYESAKDSGRSTRAFSASADLQTELLEVRAQLEIAQSTSNSVKNKLRDCSKQLQEYENERAAIIEVLQRNGIETIGLRDESFESDAGSASTEGEDLADAVSKLAQRLVEAKANVANMSQKAFSSQSNSSVLARLRNSEETVSRLQQECDEARAQRSIFDKRIETMKSAARAAREEVASLLAKVETLTQRNDEIAEELEQERQRAEKMAAIAAAAKHSSDEISPEIQALEEENIELMQENKELRIEASSYRVQAEKALLKLKDLESSGSTAAASTRKRSFGTELGKRSSPSSTTSRSDNSTKSQKRNLVSDPETVAAEENVRVNANVSLESQLLIEDGGGKERRTRTKAKSTTTIATTDGAISSTGQPVGNGESAGECVQS